MGKVKRRTPAQQKRTQKHLSKKRELEKIAARRKVFEDEVYLREENKILKNQVEKAHDNEEIMKMDIEEVELEVADYKKLLEHEQGKILELREQVSELSEELEENKDTIYNLSLELNKKDKEINNLKRGPGDVVSRLEEALGLLSEGEKELRRKDREIKQWQESSNRNSALAEEYRRKKREEEGRTNRLVEFIAMLNNTESIDRFFGNDEVLSDLITSTRSRLIKEHRKFPS